MTTAGNSRITRTITLLITISSLSLPAYAQYSGGTGEPNDPYQIATAEDLMLLGETPEDYDKHFILTADIDLDPNLPGRKILDRAVIAPDTVNNHNQFQGISFTGIFDGSEHTISHLTILGQVDYLGLFGQLGPEAEISSVGLVDSSVANAAGTRRINCIGLLVGQNKGSVSGCHSTSSVAGEGSVGGLVGINEGSISFCYSAGTVSGEWSVGGLVGRNEVEATINMSYSTASVSGDRTVGGLVGYNGATITMSYSNGSVSGDSEVGGLVGEGEGGSCITMSYSTGMVTGNSFIGGLVGESWGRITMSYSVGIVKGEEFVGGLVGSSKGDSTNSLSFWDIETSGQLTSAGGTGLSTPEMQNINTYLSDGWDFVGEILNGTCDYWQISPDAYPRFSYHIGSSPVMPEGLGTAEQPYQIQDAQDLGTVWFKPIAYYRLVKSIDLSGIMWSKAVVPWFEGTFEGNGHIISNLHIRGDGHLGMFGELGPEAKISNLGLKAIDIDGTSQVGGLACINYGIITSSYSTGIVTGNGSVGGLVGSNHSGSIITSHSTATVTGEGCVGGLTGGNYGNSSIITNSYSTGTVTGNSGVGGLIGYQDNGSTTSCYSTGKVKGEKFVGGLVGYNEGFASITASYSAGTVTGESNVGGLVGFSEAISITSLSFWDMETSGQTTSGGGIGLTTHEMQDINTYLSEGWDFVDEILNGTCDYWQISPGEYPRFRYQDSENLQMPEGLGTAGQPYLIRDIRDLGTVWFRPLAHYRMETSLDLSGIKWSIAIVPWFDGTFEGNGHVISNLHIQGSRCLGLFGQLSTGAKISNLGLEAVNVEGTGSEIGGLAGHNNGFINRSYSIGTVTGEGQIGGLVGDNSGSIITGYSSGTVTGRGNVGGLTGHNVGLISNKSYSSGTVTAEGNAGGLVGLNNGSVTSSYSTGAVTGIKEIGGLVGSNQEKITTCYSIGAVNGNNEVGGLVGDNINGEINCSYSTGVVDGTGEDIGGLVGCNDHSVLSIAGIVTECFWDVETSGQKTSAGGTGKTTAEMQTSSTFLEAGWDFVDETANGTEDIWWIDEGQDYPRLW